MRVSAIGIGVLVLCALIGSVQINAEDLNDQAAAQTTLPPLKLQNLMGETPIVLKTKESNLLFVTFFEDKCRWCLRQMNAYQKFKNKMNAEFVMVGVGGSKYKLRHWAKRAGTSLPTAYASEELLSLVGIPEMTPYTLIFDSQGYFLSKVTGYIKPEVLSKIAKMENSSLDRKHFAALTRP